MKMKEPNDSPIEEAAKYCVPEDIFEFVREMIMKSKIKPGNLVLDYPWRDLYNDNQPTQWILKGRK